MQASQPIEHRGKGQAAMAFEHPALERYTEDMRWDIAEVPMGPSGTRVTRGAVGAWSIPTWSKDPEAAWAFISMLASMEGQMRYLEEGLGGTRFDSIRESLIYNDDPSMFQPPLHPDSFQNRDVYLTAMQYAEIDVERQLLAEHIPELGYSDNTPLGNAGDITRSDRPVAHIIAELEQKINAILRDDPDVIAY